MVLPSSRTISAWLALLALLGFTNGYAAAQNETKAVAAAPVETFESHSKPWLAAGIVEFPFYWFYLGGPAIKGQAYLPNFNPRLGLRASYKDWGAQLTFGVPILGHAERARRGDSTQSGGAIQTYWRQNAFDVYYQAFRGFYVSDPFTELSSDKPDRYPQLPDTRVLNIGFNWYYALDPAKYSLKAAFDHQEMQLASGGSWIVNPFFNHFEMQVGTAFVPGSSGATVTSLPNLASGRYDTLGFAFGYGQTYVRHRWFLTLQGTAGPGLQFQRVDRSDGNGSDTLALSAKFNVNVSAGWNDPEKLGGVKLLVDSLSTRVVDVQVTSSLITAQLFFGYRF